MTKRVIRTTRRIQTDGDAAPVETVHEREVDRVLRNGAELQAHEQDETVPVYYTTEPVVHVTGEQATALTAWLHSLQHITQRQLTILRNLDYRLTRLEAVNRARDTTPGVERATWWALWGLLMLILGAALVVILILIFSATLH
jgi:hypothetical protein